MSTEPPADRLARRIARRLTDERVIRAVAEVPREYFVPPQYVRAAWRDRPLPIGAGQTISQPLLVARMCELLELRGDEHVLDVGTGSGYHAALLAKLAAWVWSIERHPELSRQAAANLKAAGIENVSLLIGDGANGHPGQAPYQAINVAAAAPDVNALTELEGQLDDGGRMVAPVGRDRQRLVLVRRDREAVQRIPLEPVRFVPLV